MNNEERESPGPLAIRWSDQARADLAAIGDYIATDNPPAAQRWVNTLIAAFEQAAEMPLAGRIVPEFQQAGLREVIRRNYRLVYRVREDHIEVLTIFEGHRLFPKSVIVNE